MKMSDHKTIDTQIVLELLNAEEELFNQIWERLVPTLGEITLSAIFHRIWRKVVNRYPVFSAVMITESGFSWQEIRRKAIKKEDLVQGSAFFIEELIHFLSEMTGNILTADVKEVLSKSNLKLEVQNGKK